MSTTSRVLTGRLRPASAADFSQYAKNLAWLLRCPLQEAQELLARAYGFADAHELRRELSTPAAAGPFDEPSRCPPFWQPAPSNKPTAQLEVEEDLSWLLHTPREARLRDLLQDHAQCQPLNRRQLGVLESGFLCAPKVHRQLFARVKAGCLALEDDDASRLLWLRSDWPIGFWPLLRELYGHASSPVGSPDEPPSASPSPDPAMVELCRLRAPHIYLVLTGNVPSLLGEYWDDFAYEYGLDFVQLSATEAGLYAESSDLAIDAIIDIADDAEVDVPEDDIDAIAESAELFIRSGADDSSQLHPLLRDLPGLTDLLSHWRLGQLRALSLLHAQQSSSFSPTLLFNDRQPWPGQVTPEANVGSPQLMLRLEVSRVVTEFDGDDLDIPLTLWNYRARFYCEAPDAFTSDVGVVTGFVIVPFDLYENIVHPNDFFEVMDSVSAQHNDVWKVLQGTYFPSKGFDSVIEWAEQHMGESIAVAHITLDPAFRGHGLVPAALNMIVSCLGRAYARFDDYGWRFEAQAAAQSTTPPIDLEDEIDPRPVIPCAPSLFVIPVPGDTPPSQLVRPHLRGSLQPVPKTHAGSSKEIAKAKLMRHFLAMREQTTADIVCYDPWEYPMT
jgi:hypothetical protein